MNFHKKSMFFAVLLLGLFLSGADAADKLRIGVLGFESKAEGVSQQQAEIITDIFTRELAQSKTIAVYERQQLEHVGREQKLGMSGLVDINTATEIGKIVGLQYIILGSVTELSQKVSGGAISIIGSATHEAMATIDIRVIDVATSEVRLAISETGSSSSTTTALVLGSNAAFVESEFGGIQARAIADAVTKLGHSLRAYTTGESSHVIAQTGDDFVLDVSAQEGALYLIYVDGQSIVGMDGVVVGREQIPLAVVKIRDVNPGHSIAVLAEGCSGKLVQRGDKVEPITSEKSKQLLSRKAFAKERPAASEGTFEQIFGGQPRGNQPAPPPAPLPPAQEAVPPAPEPSAEPVVQPAAQPAVQPTPQPAAQPTPLAPAANARVIEGFDPNTSTDSKVIDTYPLASAARVNLGIKHRGAYNLYSQGKFKQAFEAFVKVAGEYEGNYLSAYWAGMSARRLKSHKEAAKWFDRAVAINPNYVPAQDAKANNPD